MTKFLVILPENKLGKTLMKGLSDAVKACGYLTIEKDLSEIDADELIRLEISTILSYGYGYLMDTKLTEFIFKKMPHVRLAHCFADDPYSEVANNGNTDYYKKLKDINPFVFVWDSTYLKDFEKCCYLPLAFDKRLYNISFEDYKYTLSFVGRPTGDKRQKILSTLVKLYGTKLSIFSDEKHFKIGTDEMIRKELLTEMEAEIFQKCYKGSVKTEHERAKVYSSSKININITAYGENNLNYRVFEVLGSSAFLLTDYVSDIDKHFEISKDLETYKDETELIDKIDFYLKHTDIAQKIGFIGYHKVVAKHTFIDRARTILSIVEQK